MTQDKSTGTISVHEFGKILTSTLPAISQNEQQILEARYSTRSDRRDPNSFDLHQFKQDLHALTK